jgi:hypothetical protein
LRRSWTSIHSLETNPWGGRTRTNAISGIDRSFSRMTTPSFPLCLAIRITSLIVRGILSVLVAVIIAAGKAVAPSLTEKIAGGMVTLVKGLFIRAAG